MSAVFSHYSDSDPEEFEYGDEAHIANDLPFQEPSESDDELQDEGPTSESLL